VGHTVHANACRAKKVDALFFMLGWAQCDFHKKRTRTRHTELMLLHPVGSAGQIVFYVATRPVKRRCTIFHTHVGPVQILQIACGDTLCLTCVFPFGVICGSRIASWCVRAVKHRFTIFNTRVGMVWIPQNVHPYT
jgi:hypothetical protein